MPPMNRRHNERGAVSGGLIGIILLTLAVVVLGGLSIWLYVQYSDQKTNVDGKIEAAVATAKRDQAETDEAKFAEREKEPNRQFVGPTDYGRLAFSYPKTWSAYVAKDGSKGGTYEAYLNPVKVPPVGASAQRFALRVLIEEQDYQEVIEDYESLIDKGDLKSSTTSSNGKSGTRLDGSFNKDVRGAVVIYKLRDKTISIFTDADTFKPDFEKIIKTIEFNQ